MDRVIYKFFLWMVLLISFSYGSFFVNKKPQRITGVTFHWGFLKSRSGIYYVLPVTAGT